jgi:hypothetical protein
MTAGLPGFGLGGLFFILSALLAPILELPRALRGRSSRARWMRITSHLALALAMIVAVELALVILVTAMGTGATHGAQATVANAGAGGAHAVAHTAGSGGLALAPLPVPPIAVTMALLGAILGIAKLADIARRTGPRVQTLRARIRPRSMDPAEERA